MDEFYRIITEELHLNIQPQEFNLISNALDINKDGCLNIDELKLFINCDDPTEKLKILIKGEMENHNLSCDDMY